MNALRTRFVGLALLGALVALTLAGCGSNSSPASSEPTAQTFDATVCLSFTPEAATDKDACFDVATEYVIPAE